MKKPKAGPASGKAKDASSKVKPSAKRSDAPAKEAPAKPAKTKPADGKAPAKPASGKPASGKPASTNPASGKAASAKAVSAKPAPTTKSPSAPAGKSAGKGKPGSASPAKSRPGAAPKRASAPVREPTRLVSLPLPTMAPVRRPSIEERASSIETRLAMQPPDFRRRYEDNLDMSWIYHDSALEGVVYTFDELRTALSGQAPPVTDSSLQPTYDDIRRHKEAIEFVRVSAAQKKLPITIDVIRKLYLILHPEEGDIKTVKYRKDIPQHRLYFHEYAPPDKVGYKVRQVVDWLNDPETRKTRNGVRIAARAQYDLVRVYPFASDSGKVARLFMNLLLMRQGLPPAIIHSTERQRYYEALKGSANVVLQMVQEAVENALSSVEKLLDEHETRKRAFVS